MTGSNTSNKTMFDEDIANLENRRSALETERQKLLSGQITVTGSDNTSLLEIDLGVLSTTAADQVTVERNLKQTLTENPLVPVLDNSFKKTRELREEMTQRGELSNRSNNKPSLLKVIRVNNRLNRKLAARNKWLGKVIASSWLMVAGFLILVLWCGGPLIYFVTEGLFGGNPARITATNTPSTTSTFHASSSPSSVKSTPTSGYSEQVGKAGKIAYLPLNNKKQIESLSSPEGENNKQEDETATPTAEFDENKSTPAQVETRVGTTPSQAGGFNGPHGAFLAPARLKITALDIDTSILRAITQNSENNNGSSIVSWPRPGEVVQTGVYPGEIGNMLVMGNQADLGGLRRLQQNDEIAVYDRQANVFIYRVVAFSPDGQTEREIDPTSFSDAWVFASTDTAVLTILVSYPQPLPPVDLNKVGQATTKVTAKDDYLTSRKLAYRAVLALYAPATVTPVGTLVAVPDQAWQTVGAPVPTTTQEITPVPALTPTPPNFDKTPVPTGSQVNPTPTIQVPSGLPDTGMGGSRFTPSKN